MNTALFFCCLIVVEFVIVFCHVSLIFLLLGDDAFLKNTPDELTNKVFNIVCSCAFMCTLAGICIFQLSTL